MAQYGYNEKLSRPYSERDDFDVVDLDMQAARWSALGGELELRDRSRSSRVQGRGRVAYTASGMTTDGG